MGNKDVTSSDQAQFTEHRVRPLAPEFVSRIHQHLITIYRELIPAKSPELDKLLAEVIDVCEHHLRQCQPTATDSRWNENDIALICYGDQVSDGDRPTLDVLNDFLCSKGCDDLLAIVHLLPINPYTSDDGFSVVDYRQVDAKLGGWDNVGALGQNFDLMLDLVLNHVSQESDYFKKFLLGEEPFRQFFIIADPSEDYSSVTRPRSLPLLSEKETIDGLVTVWTTFSDDQIDLDFRSPVVLVEMLDVLLFYARQGGRIIRLDAIAYLWKKIGTSCIHLKETHEVVKLMRTCFDAVSSRSLLLTETNVPHDENISYFGDGDEAHMVYQFSLPPLLLDAFFSGDASTIATWMKSVCTPLEGTTFFNFTASHDGIGVRPLEGIVSPERIQALADAARSCGGAVGTKTNSDGTDSPYELNVTYLDMLLTQPESESPGIDRFISSQAVMLAMKGIPGIYFHSLFGTQNDVEAAKASKIPRRINRRKFELEELKNRLAEPTSLPARIFNRYKRLLEIRRTQPAFHPDADQRVCPSANPSLLTFQRECQPSGQLITIVTNFSPNSQTIATSDIAGPKIESELISADAIEADSIEIGPFGCLWLLHAQS